MLIGVVKRLWSVTMPSPMGPFTPDPNDPEVAPGFEDSDELWDDDAYARRWPTGMRLVALVVLVAFVLVYALSVR